MASGFAVVGLLFHVTGLIMLRIFSVFFLDSRFHALNFGAELLDGAVDGFVLREVGRREAHGEAFGVGTAEDGTIVGLISVGVSKSVTPSKMVIHRQ